MECPFENAHIFGASKEFEHTVSTAFSVFCINFGTNPGDPILLQCSAGCELHFKSSVRISASVFDEGEGALEGEHVYFSEEKNVDTLFLGGLVVVGLSGSIRSCLERDRRRGDTLTYLYETLREKNRGVATLAAGDDLRARGVSRRFMTFYHSVDRFPNLFFPCFFPSEGKFIFPICTESDSPVIFYCDPLRIRVVRHGQLRPFLRQDNFVVLVEVDYFCRDHCSVSWDGSRGSGLFQELKESVSGSGGVLLLLDWFEFFRLPSWRGVTHGIGARHILFYY